MSKVLKAKVMVEPEIFCTNSYLRGQSVKEKLILFEV